MEDRNMAASTYARGRADERCGPIGAALAVFLVLLSTIAPARADAPTVVVSIKPIHSLVASVMAGVGEPVLLVDGNVSPHSWTLKPSQAAALADAGLVVWIGDGLESYLAAPVESLVSADRVLELADLPAIELLPLREGGVWEPHVDDGDAHDSDEHADGDHAEAHAEDDQDEHADDHAAGEHAHEHAGYDPHLWLDPENAVAIARAVADRLIAIDPANATSYRTNLAALTDAIGRLDAATAAALAPVHDAPYIVFHDAFQYFEKRYGLAGVGSITLDPEQGASAARLEAIRERLAEADVVCAFAEPRIDPGLLETAIEGSAVRVATLDPEGIALEPGPGLYARLIGDIAGILADCLAAGS
jgi:zinc transport system substrate-binding protein